MSCPQCAGVDSIFNDKTAKRDLRKFHKRGPAGTTRLLINALKANAPQAQSLLDIGGGIGVIQHALFEAGLTHATAVDASAAYLQTARLEAERRGNAAHLDTRLGDFTELADSVTSADLVTLDRVFCCYPDADHLALLSVARCRQTYGLVLPRERWWIKHILRRLINGLMFMLRNPFRFFVHPLARIESVLTGSGFEQRFSKGTVFWQVLVYQKRNDAEL